MLLLQCVLDDLGTWCCTSTSRDLKEITARVEHEGLSFLTITLPDFCADFQKSLDRGWVDHDLFKSFSFAGGLPRLFGGFLDLVFDRGTGRLLDVPSVEAIFAVRQITLMFGKIELPCSDTRISKAFQNYIKCEQEVRDADIQLSSHRLDDFSRMASRLWGDIFSHVDLQVYMGDVTPSHGPGATADKLIGNQKFNQRLWTHRLEAVFPSHENLIPHWRYLEVLDRVTYLEPGAEIPVRVITVPKTLKTPRIIAIEPTHMQYMQQGIRQLLYETIERDNLLSWFVNFSDQGPNQLLAESGSETGKLATLDLSEASDRVSNQLVRRLFANHPHLREAVDATRSRKADVPGYGVVRLAKFASMGSALCFPIEAIVFCTVVFLGIQKSLNRQLTLKDIKSFRGRVRIYGDDIIVPVDHVRSVVDELEAFGFRVNTGKSFWTGKFRESCGKEYYDGHDVSISRVRAMLPSQRRDVSELISTVSLRNQLYKAGLWKSVRYLDSLIEDIIPFPAVEETSPALGKFSFLGYTTERLDSNLQKPMVKAAVVVSRIPKNSLEDSGALLKFFLKRGDMPVADRKHLERSGRPEAVDIKLRWTHSY